MKTRVWRLPALCVLAVFCIAAASAHGGKHDAPGSDHAEAFGRAGVAKNVTRTVAISMTDAMRFQPDALIFKQGESVRLRITNDGRIPHEFVLGNKEEIAEHAEMMRKMPGMAHADASSVRLAAGKSADIVWQFSKKGKFFYACLIPGHWEAGMQGSVTVTGPVRR